MKVVFTLLIFFWSIENCLVEAGDYKILKVENCSSSDGKVVVLKDCSVSSTGYTINSSYFFQRPIKDIVVSIRKVVNANSYYVIFYHKQAYATFFFKNGTNYRQVFKTIRVDWCSLISDGKKANGLFRVLIEMSKNQVPEITHQCPYSGAIRLINFKFPKLIMTLLTVGIIRYDLKIVFDKKCTTLYRILIEITS